jgi:hypothetical protein
MSVTRGLVKESSDYPNGVAQIAGADVDDATGHAEMDSIVTNPGKARS